MTATGTPATTVPPGQLEPHESGFGYWYDPDLIAADRNIRTDAEESVDADPEFIASIKAAGGNHTPAHLVVTSDGKLRAWKGNRRLIGCRRARTRLWGFAVPEGTSKADRERWIIEQVSENEDRAGLRPQDRAGAVLALFELGVTAAGVGKRLPRLSKAEIGAARAFAANPFAAPVADAHPDWTLDMDAAAGEFAAAGDDEAVQALEAAAQDSPGRFAHVAAEYRATAAERAERRALTAALAARGFDVTAGRVPSWQEVRYLRDDRGAPLTPDSHESCPGRGVIIGQNWHWPDGAEAAWRAANQVGPDDEIEFASEEEAQQAGYVLRWEPAGWYCTDPTGNGHHHPSGRPSQADQSEAEKEAERAKARLIRANNKLWYAATEVRAAHLRDLLGRKTAPAGARRFVLTAMLGVRYDRALRDALDRGHELAADLLGMPERGGPTAAQAIDQAAEQASDKRLEVLELAVAAGAYERLCRDPHVWQNGGHAGYMGVRHAGVSPLGLYLRYLESTGYGLSDLERDVAFPPAGGTETGPERGPEPEPAEVAPAPGEVDRGSGTGPDPGRLARLAAEHEDATWRPEAAGERMCQAHPDDCPNGPEPHVYAPDDGHAGGQAPRDGWYPCCVQPAEQNGQAS